MAERDLNVQIGLSSQAGSGQRTDVYAAVAIRERPPYQQWGVPSTLRRARRGVEQMAIQSAGVIGGPFYYGAIPRPGVVGVLLPEVDPVIRRHAVPWSATANPNGIAFCRVEHLTCVHGVKAIGAAVGHRQNIFGRQPTEK